MHWYFRIIKEKYATFDGRTSRSEFWKFYGITMLLFTVTVLLDLLIIEFSDDAIYAGYISLIFVFVLFLPILAATARRLHDTGKSSWYLLLNLIPLLGGATLLFLLLMAGQRGSNKYDSET